MTQVGIPMFLDFNHIVFVVHKLVYLKSKCK